MDKGSWKFEGRQRMERAIARAERYEIDEAVYAAMTETEARNRAEDARRALLKRFGN
jgi:hypothetical protein